MQKKYEPSRGPEPFRDSPWLREALDIGETEILPSCVQTIRPPLNDPKRARFVQRMPVLVDTNSDDTVRSIKDWVPETVVTTCATEGD